MTCPQIADGRRSSAPFETRFAASWQPGPGGCCLWLRAKNNRGYGVIWFDGKVRLAHRVAWRLTYGRWPTPGLVLDHQCDTKACVNVGHLLEVTNAANILRAPASPMNVVRSSPLCRNDHAYPDDVEIDKNGWRVCPTCRDLRGGWTS